MVGYLIMSRNIINRNIIESPNSIEDIKLNGKPVLINNDVFLSIKLASLFLKINRSTIIYRLNSKSDKFKNWRYLDKNNVVDKSLIIYEITKLKHIQNLEEETPWD